MLIMHAQVDGSRKQPSPRRLFNIMLMISGDIRRNRYTFTIFHLISLSHITGAWASPKFCTFFVFSSGNIGYKLYVCRVHIILYL